MKKIFLTLDKRIVIWFKAFFLDYPYYRIESKKGEDGELLTGFTYKKRAKALAKQFTGKAFIDYNFIILRDKDAK